MQDRMLSKEERATFQYIKLVEEFIAFANNQLKDHGKQKSLRSIITALESLGRTVQDSTGKYGVKPALEKSEQLRNASLSVPDSLDKLYEKAIKEKRKAEEAYDKLPQQHDENRNKLTRLLQAKVEDMNLDQLREIGITAKKNQQLILNYEELDSKLTTKRAELRKLDAKIQAHCCGGALCNKEDLIRQRNIDHEINVLIALQQEVRANPVDAPRSKEELGGFKKQLDAIRQEIQEQIDGYEGLRKKARKKVEEATRAISDINQRIKADQLEKCRVVDQDTMFNLVHLRARLSGFYRMVDKVYKADASTNLVLDSFTSARNDWRDKFNNALGAIFYPSLTGRSGLRLYSDYVEWSKLHVKEREEIESAEYSPNQFITAVVPEMKKAEVNPLHTSTLGTVHDFFPTVDRVKKKKSVDVASITASADAKPGLRASSSTTTS